MATPLPVMSGGMREIMIDFTQKHSNQAEIILGILLVIAITFVEQIPSVISRQATTLPGRLLSFVILLGILSYTRWLHGFLFVVLVALMMVSKKTVEGFLGSHISEGFSSSKQSQSTKGAEGFSSKNKSQSTFGAEGFEPSDYSTLIVPSKKKWFVEEVLGENPVAIVDEKVRTSAIQDNGRYQKSSVQDSKSVSK
jgi:hypothetical protein